MPVDYPERMTWYIPRLSVDLAFSHFSICDCMLETQSYCTSAKALDADGGEEETFGAEREGREIKKRNG